MIISKKTKKIKTKKKTNIIKIMKGGSKVGAAPAPKQSRSAIKTEIQSKVANMSSKLHNQSKLVSQSSVSNALFYTPQQKQNLLGQYKKMVSLNYEPRKLFGFGRKLKPEEINDAKRKIQLQLRRSLGTKFVISTDPVTKKSIDSIDSIDSKSSSRLPAEVIAAQIRQKKVNLNSTATANILSMIQKNIEEVNAMTQTDEYKGITPQRILEQRAKQLREINLGSSDARKVFLMFKNSHSGHEKIRSEKALALQALTKQRMEQLKEHQLHFQQLQLQQSQQSQAPSSPSPIKKPLLSSNPNASSLANQVRSL